MTQREHSTASAGFPDAPEISRRRFLLNTSMAGAAVAAVAAPAAAVAMSEQRSIVAEEIDENAQLIEAWKQFRDAEAEYYAAKDALGWLVDEWKHLWPLAPEEILGGANATGYGPWADRVERDLIGRPLVRDTIALTKRLTKSFRQENERTCFYIDQADKVAKDLEEARRRKVTGRTPRALERNRKWHDDYVAGLKIRLRLAKEYENETQRIRTLAGVDAAKQRIETAEARFSDAAAAVSKQPSRTLVGLRLKADALLSSLEKWSIPRYDGFIFGAVWRLVEDTLDATQDLDGKRSAAPLPTVEGGAA